MDRSRSLRRSRRGRWVGKVIRERGGAASAPPVAPRASRRSESGTRRCGCLSHVPPVVVVTKEEGVGALLRAEDAAVLADPARRAGPLEADRALLQPLVLVAGVAGDTFHWGPS